jgi:hypothetical protein
MKYYQCSKRSSYRCRGHRLVSVSPKKVRVSDLLHADMITLEMSDVSDITGSGLSRRIRPAMSEGQGSEDKRGDHLPLGTSSQPTIIIFHNS